jgi:hypothetical protein
MSSLNDTDFSNDTDLSVNNEKGKGREREEKKINFLLVRIREMLIDFGAVRH